MPELLSPAGNLEKMKAAVLYGCDAVYLAGKSFGMRSAADNFTCEELAEAVSYAHGHGVRVYLTVNTMPHGDEYPALREYLKEISGYGIDAFIVADPGVIDTLREIMPQADIHISTQASIVSPAAALSYVKHFGVKRLVLARELKLDEIRAIRQALPEEVQIEAFIHGSMCVSYSGRCLLSNMLTGRDANRGMCTQPCRWNYTLYEEKRPDFPIPIEQNELGTFIMSSKDMCMIEHIPELVRAGVDSFKIEGRMKSAYYTAVVTNAYRMAIDRYKADPDHYQFDPAWLRELESVTHREYATGFYFDDPQEKPQISGMTGYIREKAYFAIAREIPEDCPLPKKNGDGYLCCFEQKNKVCVGDAAEIISPGRTGRACIVDLLYDENGQPLECAPHPSMIFYTYVPFEVRPGDIMRAGS
ncbi:MAG: U32 family peptidase [Clostridia bacterium]|nr:U32 family peptidase [Clostridia bacterium]